MKYTKKQKEYDSFVEKHNGQQEIINRKKDIEKFNNIKINILISILGIIFLILVCGGSIYFGNIDFDYNLKKCVTLDSSQSSYDFSNTMEIDAKYNEECYYLTNHPYARFMRVYLQSILVGVLATIFIILLMILIKIMVTPLDSPFPW